MINFTQKLGKFKNIDFIKDVFNNVKMDIPTCTENLIIFYNLLANFSIPAYISFGTLLGAYRDNSLIPYDKDTDIAILEESDIKLCDLLCSESFKKEFTIGRIYEKRDHCLISVVRLGEYIDLYLFRHIGCQHQCFDYRQPDKFLNNPSSISFLGQQFLTVGYIEEYLQWYYGKNWRRPKKDEHAKSPS